MNLNIFNTTNLFEAATNLFQQLNIKLNSNTAEPLPTKDILKHHYKDNDTFKAIDKTFFIGLIDDSVLRQQECLASTIPTKKPLNRTIKTTTA